MSNENIPVTSGSEGAEAAIISKGKELKVLVC